MTTKYCCGCRTEKPVKAFHKNAAKSDGLNTHCKTCKASTQKQWYAKHTDEQKERVGLLKAQRIKNNRERVNNYLLQHPCLDCGEKDTIVLEFDHVRGKKIDIISKMIFDCGWSKIQKEILKCEVRCANCHRRITRKRKLDCKL